MQYSNLGFSHMCSTRASFTTVEVSSSHMHYHASDVDIILIRYRNGFRLMRASAL